MHVSALGASLDSPSKWAVSKFLGEKEVKDAFPSATIIRPATMFGDADRFLNRIAYMAQSFPFLPLVDADTTYQQPVYADDVAAAIIEAVANPALQGQTLELAGPKTYTNQQIVDHVLKVMAEPQNTFNVPPSLGMALAFGVQQLPDAWLTCDRERSAESRALAPVALSCPSVPSKLPVDVCRSLCRRSRRGLFMCTCVVARGRWARDELWHGCFAWSGYTCVPPLSQPPPSAFSQSCAGRASTSSGQAAARASRICRCPG